MKSCKYCRQPLTTDNWIVAHKKGRERTYTYILNFCRSCRSVVNRAQYVKHPEYHRARAKRYRDADPERAKCIRQRHYQLHPERMKAAQKRLYEQNPAYYREKARQYASEHREERRQYNRVYHATHQEEERQYRQTHPEVGRNAARRRRALLLGATTFEPIDRRYLYDRDRGICHICRKKVRFDRMTLDHLIPLSNGGDHTHQNLALAHHACNARRGAGRLPAQLLLIG